MFQQRTEERRDNMKDWGYPSSPMKIQFVMLQRLRKQGGICNNNNSIKYRSETDDKSRNLLTSQIATYTVFENLFSFVT